MIAGEAEAEIKHAKAWYEKQKKGLGKTFAGTIKEAINSLKSDTVGSIIVSPPKMMEESVKVPILREFGVLFLKRLYMLKAGLNREG